MRAVALADDGEHALAAGLVGGEEVAHAARRIDGCHGTSLSGRLASAARISARSPRSRSRSARSASHPLRASGGDEREQRVAELGLGRGSGAPSRARPGRARRPGPPCRAASARARATASARSRRRARWCARCFSAAFAAFQCTSTSSGVFATASPKTCGCRRTIFSVSPRATSSMSNGSSGSREAISAWNSTCQSRSPSSSRSSARDPVLDGVDQLGALLDEVRHERAVVDLLRPDAAVAHRAHRVGGRAERIGLRSCRGTSGRGAPRREAAVVARTPRHEDPASDQRDHRAGQHAEDRLVADRRAAPAKASSDSSSETVKPMPPSAPAATGRRSASCWSPPPRSPMRERANPNTGDADDLADREGDQDAPERRRQLADATPRGSARAPPRTRRAAGRSTLTHGSSACRVRRAGLLRHREAEQHAGDRRVHAGERARAPRSRSRGRRAAIGDRNAGAACRAAGSGSRTTTTASERERRASRS